MRHLLPLLALLFVAVAGLTAVAWVRVGRGRHEDLERMGDALAQTVRGAALETRATVQAAERYLADRLTTVARRADEQVASRHEPAHEILQRIAREEGIGRIFLLDRDGHPVAAAAWPAPLPEEEEGALLTADRRRSLAWQSVKREVDAVTVLPGRTVIEGHRANVFGTRDRFGVIFGRQDGGTLVVRAAAEALQALGRRFGLEPVLQRIAQVPGVEAVRVRASNGAVLAAGGNARTAEAPEGANLEVDLPVAEAGHPAFTVELILSRAWADQAARNSRRAILLGAGLALLVLAAASVTLRIREDQTRRLRARLEEERAAEARLAEMGGLAGLVTHEISNPVNALRLGLGVLRSTPPGDEQAAILAKLEAEIVRIAATLEGTMGLAGSSPSRRETLGSEVLERALGRVAGLASERDVRVEKIVSDPTPRTRAQAVVLEQALANVLRNAVQVTPPGGVVRTTWEDAAEGMLRVVIEDEGPGFPPDRARLLRLGGSRRQGGHGLGLPLTRRFVEGFGGRLHLEDRAAGGARVVILLPRTDGEEETDA